MGNWQQTPSVYNLRDVARLVLSGLGLLNPALGKSEELPPDPTLEKFFQTFRSGVGIRTHVTFEKISGV